MSTTIHDPAKVDASPTDARPPVPPRPRREAVDPITAAMNAAAAGMQQPILRQPPQQQHGGYYQQQPPVMAAPPWADNAVGSLLTAVLNQRRDVGSKFHMLLIPETELPSLQSFDTIEELKAAIKPKLDTSVHVYCFMGHSLRVTKGPFHFLQTPYGAIPLHEVPTPTADDVIDGWMGTETPVTDFSLPATESAADTSDDADIQTFDDEDDDGGTELF